MHSEESNTINSQLKAKHQNNLFNRDIKSIKGDTVVASTANNLLTVGP